MGHHLGRLARGLAVALTGVLLLAGCSGNDDSAPPVAALPSSSTPASAAPATSAADGERPLIRPDTSDEQALRWAELYYACLRDHGVPTLNQNGYLKPKADNGDPRYASAWQACASKEPEDLMSRLARTDPSKYQDMARAYINCMKSHGLRAKADPKYPGNFSYEADSMPMAQQMEFADQCDTVAYAKY